MHCHTSSGRYRFKAAEKTNDACLPCHAERVKSPAAHTRHKTDGPGGKCVSCHMPMTVFARTMRTDHSMRPPTPAASISYKSPNACTICHTGKSDAWADKIVRRWRKGDYQAPVLKRAKLVDDARKGNWKKLPEMLEYLRSDGRDEITATSLIRLLKGSGDARVYPAMIQSMSDPSPLVRAAATEAVGLKPSAETVRALLKAAEDDFRIVRVRAAAALAVYPKALLKSPAGKDLARATEEYRGFLMTRPDLWSSYFSLGNMHLNRGEFPEAVTSYQNALTIEPRAIAVLVSSSLAYGRIGEDDKAEQALRQALTIAPDNASANFSMGLLQDKRQNPAAAERYFKAALSADGRLDYAAYRLCGIAAPDRLPEAINWCRKAAELNPFNASYAYTLAMYQEREGKTKSAVQTLVEVIAKNPAHGDSYLLLGGLYEKLGNMQEAAGLYSRALLVSGISPYQRNQIESRLEALKTRVDKAK